MWKQFNKYMSEAEMFYAKKLLVTTRTVVLKKLQQNCVKKAPHSLTVHRRGNRCACFLPNLRINSFIFCG